MQVSWNALMHKKWQQDPSHSHAAASRRLKGLEQGCGRRAAASHAPSKQRLAEEEEESLFRRAPALSAWRA